MRNNVGMFDISHMGQLIVEGSGARDWLNTMLTNNIDKLDVGTGQYTFLLNERGGIIDDLIVYRIEEQKIPARRQRIPNGRRFRLAAKASSGRRVISRQGVSLENRSANFGGVAIQGPRVTELFQCAFRR